MVMDEKRGPFKVMGSKVMYKNPWMEVREDAVIRPDGKDGIFGVVTTLEGVFVLPIKNDGTVYLIKEYRYAVNMVSLEVCAGGVDPGEDIEHAAERELEEETGIVDPKLIAMGMMHTGTQILYAPSYMYLAIDFKEGQPHHESGELIEVVEMPLDEAVAKVYSGEIVHAIAAFLVLKAERWWRENRA